MTRDADKENRVTALVDCDNTTPDVLEYAILEHIGESSQPPRIAPARGPPLWEAAESAGNDPQWDAGAAPGPEIEFDQRIAW